MAESTALKHSPSVCWKMFHVLHFCISIGLVITVAHEKFAQLNKKQSCLSDNFHRNTESRDTARNDHFIVKRSAKLTDEFLTKVKKQFRNSSETILEELTVKEVKRKEISACLDMLQRYLINATSDESPEINTICKNFKGPPGNPGPRGHRGKRGKRGQKGLQGRTGPKGSSGKHGPPGPRGEKGFSGNMTIIGLKGDMGPSGIKGDKGERGPRGSPGQKGTKGDSGGPKGDRGEVGKTGERGCPGDSFAAPKFMTTPQHVVFAEKDEATLVCKAMANPYSQITWYRHGVKLSNKNTRYGVKQNRTISQVRSVDRRNNCSITSHPVTQSTLVIKNAKGSDRGKYICKVKNVMGESTYQIKLNIQEYVKFTTTPTNTTAVEGNTTFLKCRATGVPEPLITWQRKDGQPMPDLHRIVLGDLNFISIVKQDEGVYECIASNVLGSNTAKAAITVNVFPKISYFTKHDITINESQTLYLPCNATGFPQPVITWTRTSGLLSKSRSTYDSQMLMVTDVTYDDRGEYVCTAINTLGSDKKRIRITVQVAPKILQRPTSTEYGFVGYNKTFVLHVFAFPPATIVWKRSGKILKTSSQENSNFTLPNVDYKDSGIYEAVARNDLGKVLATTVLAVQDPVGPMITSQFENIFISKDDRENAFVRKCTAFGIPKPRISWIFNGSVVTSKVGHSLSLIVATRPLRLTGIYTCEATNRFGTSKKQFGVYNYTSFSVTGSGRFGQIQTYHVTSSGLYLIRAGGARGGTHTYNYGYKPGTYYGGKGATMEGKFRLSAGTTLNIVVGQRGGNSVEVKGGQDTSSTAAQLGKSIEDQAGTGGGGGSFVYTTTNKLLIAAGGGGGASAGYHGIDGQSGTSGTASIGSESSQSRAGGTNGNPGVCNTAGGNYHGGVGAGWLGQGCTRKGKEHGERGGSRGQGWVGGRAGSMNSGNNGGPPPGAVGGFGGGGGGSEDNGASGGGGGYSGGGSGTQEQQAGGGGGSYCSGTSCRGVTGGNSNDNGFVEIQFLGN